MSSRISGRCTVVVVVFWMKRLTLILLKHQKTYQLMLPDPAPINVNRQWSKQISLSSQTFLKQHTKKNTIQQLPFKKTSKSLCLLDTIGGWITFTRPSRNENSAFVGLPILCFSTFGLCKSRISKKRSSPGHFQHQDKTHTRYVARVRTPHMFFHPGLWVKTHCNEYSVYIYIYIHTYIWKARPLKLETLKHLKL